MCNGCSSFYLKEQVQAQVLEPQPELQVSVVPVRPLPVQVPASQQQVAEQLVGPGPDHPWSLFCAWLVEDCGIPLTLLLKSCLSCWSLILYSCPSLKSMKLHGDGAACLLETCWSTSFAE